MLHFYEAFDWIKNKIGRIFDRQRTPGWVDIIGRDSFAAMSGWMGDEPPTAACVYVTVETFWHDPRYPTLTLHPPTSAALSHVPDDRELSFSEFSDIVLAQHTPSFAYHVLSCARNPDTMLQPAVRREWDCWVVRRSDGDLCVGLANRLYWDFNYTVYSVFQYESPQHRQRVVRTGMLIVPTHNVWIETTDEEEDPVEGFKIHPEFEKYRKAVPLEAHEGVQLTFEYGRVPSNVVAEAVSGSALFDKELKAIRENGRF